MLFWTRAFLCIGTVTVMALGRAPTLPKMPAAPSLAAPAAALAGEACRARPELCAGLLTGGVKALSRPPAAPPTKPGTARRVARAGPEVALGRGSLT